MSVKAMFFKCLDFKFTPCGGGRSRKNFHQSLMRDTKKYTVKCLHYNKRDHQPATPYFPAIAPFSTSFLKLKFNTTVVYKKSNIYLSYAKKIWKIWKTIDFYKSYS